MSFQELSILEFCFGFESSPFVPQEISSILQSE